MIYRSSRFLIAIFTTFLIPISHCFGATIYVNINNSTPGNGSSWAFAYNNLQSALTVAGSFDQIWIAQGTYRPSTPAGRSATFAVPGGTAIYGGFNGTETVVTQANPALYPTILSGDIGVAGNASDNCYHVLTYNANLWIGNCSGVTIRDGQADAGSSGVAQPDNTGGGVLFLSVNTSSGTGTYFSNCIFSNNYAFYGGAIGAYANGLSGSQVNYNAKNCFFKDNQAVYGGAIYNTIVATDYLYVFEDDIFYNNTASSGAASVFGNAITNGTSTAILDMEYCLFYNEAAPIFTNDFTNSTFGSRQFDYNIVWTSGTPYTAAYSAGNTPLAITNSDINGSFPLGSNMDADPLFVDAAGGDFHLSPCSPVIDQGGTYAETPDDIGGSPRMQGPAVDLGPYETLKGTVAAAPSVSTPVNLCQYSTASDLSGDAIGANLLWYTTAAGGTGSSTAPTPSTATLATTAYYVTQTPAGSCESPRQEIDVTLITIPSAPTFTPPSPYCENATAAPLDATGTDLQWYTNATGGTPDATPPTPSTNSAGTFTWYVTQTASGCESQRTAIGVTVSPPSAEPTPNAIPEYCFDATAAQLTANGANLRWYTTATGGAGNPAPPTPGTTTPGTTAYYVTQTPASSCESNRLEIDVTVTPPPAPPTFIPPSPYCTNATAAQLSANGTDLLWYPSATGGTGAPTAPIPGTTTPGTFTWYVTQTAGGCESQRSAVPVTVNPNPTITIDPVTNTPCPGGSVKLRADGADSYLWSPATGLSDPAASNPIATLQSDILYTVTGTTGGCSATAQIDLTVNTSCSGSGSAGSLGSGYYIPNAFTPNGDGANDLFRIKTGDAPKSFIMTIFNRYGGKIFESVDIGSGWNGTIGGNLAPAGTYVYAVALTTSSGQHINRQGTVILIR